MSKRICLVIISIFLIFGVLIYPYINYIRSSENPLIQSVLYKLMLYRPTKEVHNSTHNVSGADMKFMYSEEGSSDVNSYDKDKEHKHQANMRENTRNGKEKIKIEDNNCTKKEIKLSRTKLPITGLVSFPGSGNTWTRHLIQQMTGLGTSSVYCDSDLRKRGFPYECHHDKSKAIVVKTHDIQHLKMFKKIVLLLRNPYDAFLSYGNFVKGGHTGHSLKDSLIKAINSEFNNWFRWYVSLTNATIIKFKGPVHVIQYETLQTDMATELRKLAPFFKLNVTNKDIECTVKLQEGNFHRLTNEKKHVELLRTVFSREKLLRLQEAARHSEKIIKDAYNINIDLSGLTEKLLLDGF